MAEPQTLTIVLKADGSGLTGTVRLSADEVRKLGAALDDAGDKGERAGKKIKEGAAASASEIGFAVKAWDAFGDIVGDVIGRMAEAVKAQVEYAASLVPLSQRLGMGTEELSAFGAAAQRNDATLKDSTNGIEALGASIVRAGSGAGAGAKQASAAFAALNVSVKDTAGNLRPTGDVMQDVAVKLARMQDGAFKTQIATKLFGESGEKLLGTLKELADDGMGGLIAKAQETGQLIGGQTAANAKRLTDQMQELQARLQGLWQGIAQDVVPTLLALSQWLTDDGTKADELGQRSSTLRGFMQGLGLAVVVTTETFRVLFTMLYGGIDIVIGVGAAAIRSMQSMGLAVAAAAALQSGNLKAAGELAAQSRDTFSKGWDDIKTHATRAVENIAAAGDEADKRIAAFQAHIAEGNKAIGQSADDAAVKVAAMLRSAAATKGTQFENVASGSKSMTVDAGVVAVAQAREAAAAQQRYEQALARTNRTAHDQGNELDRLNQMLARDAQVIAQLRGEADATQKVYQDYVKQVIAANAAYQQEMAIAEKAGASTETLAQIKASYTARIEASQAALDRETASLAAAGDVLGIYMAKAKNDAALAAMSPRAQAVARAVDEITVAWKKAAAEGKPMKGTLEDVTKAYGDNAGRAFDAREAASELNNIISEFGTDNGFDSLVDKLQKVQAELVKVSGASKDAFDTERVKRLQIAVGNIRQAIVDGIVTSAQSGLRSLQSMTTEGSKAFQAMQIAIDALTVVQAISAILNQGQGDPYTAFARMAAMAAAVATLVGDLHSFSAGSFKDSSKQQQATQGTGSVLGDTTAKSDSIAKAIDITAKATTALVGLNRGMLTALQALQSALGAAGNQLARGAGDADFSHDSHGMLTAGNGAAAGAAIGTAFMPVVGTLVGAVIGAVLGKLLGGSSKVIDQGVYLSGGSLDDVGVSAYQTEKYKSWRFGSSHTKDYFGDVPDEFAKQFQLVIQSIVDTVRAAATALGVSKEDIDARLAAFKVEAQKISLKGLSAEDQQKELQAVFSKLFDDIAGAVVPFIEKFQKVGEGLGETLVRVATEVQVSKEAFKQLGLAVAETDPEKFAQIADSLITAAGGIDAFTQGLSTFVSNFASDDQKFKIASDALTSAFAQVGLTVPSTRQGMWDLMQTLDATTESGRAQIATLLRLAATAGQYYDLLEARQKAAIDAQKKAIDDLVSQSQSQTDYASFIADLNKEGAGLSTISPLRAMVLQAQQWAQDSTKRAIELARAAGLQGASEKDLALIRQIESKKIAQAVQDILNQLKTTVDDFYDRGKTASSAITSFGSAMTSAAEAAKNAAELLLGELSPLNDQQKLQYALGAYERGTIGANDVLEIGRRLYASSQAYTDLFNRVMATRPPTDTGSSAGGNSSGSSASDTQETAEQRAARHRADADAILQGIASVVAVQGGSYEDVAKLAGTSLADLAKAMGFSNDQLKAYLDNIVAQDHAVTNTIDANTDRIVKALYDIAGRAVPSNLVIDHPVGTPAGGRVVDMPVDEPTAPGKGRGVEPPPPGNGDGASAGRGNDNGSLIDALHNLRPLLEAIVANASANTGDIVTAISSGTQATRDVSDVLDRTEQRRYAEERR